MAWPYNLKFGCSVKRSVKSKLISSNVGSLLEQDVDDNVIYADGFDLYVVVINLLVMRFNQSSLGMWLKSYQN